VLLEPGLAFAAPKTVLPFQGQWVACARTQMHSSIDRKSINDARAPLHCILSYWSIMPTHQFIPLWDAALSIYSISPFAVDLSLTLPEPPWGIFWQQTEPTVTT